MLDKNDLQAIAAMLREELEPINNRLDDIDPKFDTVQQEIAGIKEDVRQTRVLVEHQDHKISLIAEQYGEIARKLERVRDVDELKDRVRVLERIVANHSDEIKELKQAQ